MIALEAGDGGFTSYIYADSGSSATAFDSGIKLNSGGIHLIEDNSGDEYTLAVAEDSNGTVRVALDNGQSGEVYLATTEDIGTDANYPVSAFYLTDSSTGDVYELTIDNGQITLNLVQ